jgi:hypothetical protein
MQLEQRHVIKLLDLQGIKLGDIAVKLSSLYAQNAYPRLSIKYCLHSLRLGRKDLTTQHVGGRPLLDDIDPEILSVLRISPFSSVRTIADSVGISVSTGYFHLVEKTGFNNYPLRWVPALVTDELRLKEVEFARRFLELLEEQRIVGFSDIVTGDESWFLQHYDHERMWCVSANKVPTRVRPTIAASKTMLTVFLSGRGTIFIDWLPSGGKFNSNYFCQHVLGPLAKILHSGQNAHFPRPIVHFDNATPLRSATTESFFDGFRFRHAPQPLYSADVSLCDFFLFGDLKAKLRGEEFQTLEQLQEAVEERLIQITPGRIERLCRHWIKRLDQVIVSNKE